MGTNNPASPLGEKTGMTYGALVQALRDMARKNIHPDLPDPQSVLNRVTALRRFQRWFGAADDTIIGWELQTQFHQQLELWLASLEADGFRAKTRRDYRSHLIAAQRCFAAQVTTELPFDFAGCVDLLIRRSGLTLVQIAAAAGVKLDTLVRWRKGTGSPLKRPELASRLEQALGAPTGCLSARLATAAKHQGNGGIVPTTEFRRRMSRVRMEEPYSLRAPGTALRNEWAALLAYKTTPIPRFERQLRGEWRTRDPARLKRAYCRWYTTLPNGKVTPTAGMKWVMVAAYLGWLSLSRERGGKGISATEVETLTWLTNKTFLEEFISWKTERSGGINHEPASFLAFICSLLHPRTGYLTQQSRFASEVRFDLQGKGWVTHCCELHAELKYLGRTLSRRAKPTRPGAEGVADLVTLAVPLQPVLDFILELERHPPSAVTARSRLAIHQRDLVFLKLIISNPLRENHFITMTWYPDNSGNLYKAADGAWRIRFPADEFKNERGAAHEPYDVGVAKWVWNSIEDYVRHGRPLLSQGQFSPYLFLGQAHRHLTTPLTSMSTRLEELTRRGIAGSPGFGAHAVRHLVATTWLKLFPRDYLTVAKLLHDKLETVIKNYAHLQREDDVRAWGNVVAELQAGRRPSNPFGVGHG
jgi:integrase